MKRIVSVFAIVMLMCAVTTPVFADAATKFKDGIKQFVTSPKNLVDDVKEEYEASEFKPLGVLGGTFKGLFNTLIDAGGGLINTFTFFIDKKKYWYAKYCPPDCNGNERPAHRGGGIS